MFEERVIRPFLDGYAKGLTPNPCLECNLHVRWGYLLQEALALGATTSPPVTTPASRHRTAAGFFSGL